MDEQPDEEVRRESMNESALLRDPNERLEEDVRLTSSLRELDKTHGHDGPWREEGRDKRRAKEGRTREEKEREERREEG